MTDDGLSADRMAVIGARIRMYRTARGLTITDVAEATRLSVAYISNLEHGRGNPTLNVLACIKNVLRVPLRELVREDGELPDDAPLREDPRGFLMFDGSDLDVLEQETAEGDTHCVVRALVGGELPVVLVGSGIAVRYVIGQLGKSAGGDGVGQEPT